MGGSFLGRHTFPFCIKYPATTLSTVLMRKWHMYSDFTVSNPFYHLQWNFDGTSILRKALKHTDGGLGCKANLPIKGLNISSWRRERKGDSVRYSAKPGIFVYVTNPRKNPRRELFVTITWIKPLYYFEFFGHRLKLNFELQLNCFPILYRNSIVWAWFEGQGITVLSGLGPSIYEYLQ